MTALEEYKCTKCGGNAYETDEIRTTGGISRFFDIQNKRFTAVICKQCGFTEFFRAKSDALGNILDFFTSG